MVIQIKVKYQLGFFIVIYRKEQMGIKYLILKQKASKGGWEFPKGVEVEGVSANKTIKGLIKNISGQVPYYIKKNSFYGKYKYSEVKKVGGEEFTGLKYRTYFAQIKETKVKLDIEKYIDFKWVDYRKAIQYLTWQNQRDCLKDVDDKSKVELIKSCGEYEFRLVEGSNEFIQLDAMLAHFSQISGKSKKLLDLHILHRKKETADDK